ncbi:MAG: hypothetical protein LUF85_08620 [Bacteroides sp.]|nr:hypothetical protein [Bacteroides sp.]
MGKKNEKVYGKSKQIGSAGTNERKKALEILSHSQKKYLANINPRNFEDVFSAPTLSIQVISEELGSSTARSMVTNIVAHTVEFFNVGKTMTDIQIVQTCTFIMELYPYFLIDDLKLCFRNAISGKYGKLYDRLDGAVILG